MLTDLFRAPWKSGPVDKRCRAIAELNDADAEHRNILIELAGEDADTSIRIAAIQQLTSVAALHELSIKLSDSAVCAEAEQRVNELLRTDHGIGDAQCRPHMGIQPRIALFAPASFGMIKEDGLGLHQTTTALAVTAEVGVDDRLTRFTYSLTSQ